MASTSAKHRTQIRNGFRLAGKLLLGFLTIVCASWLAIVETSAQDSDPVKTETQRTVASLNTKLKEVNQSTSRDAELQAQCRVNCSNAKLQAEMANLKAQRLRASNELIAQIHGAVNAYIISTANGSLSENNRNRVEQDLKQILGETAVAEPASFLLDSPQGRALIVFYAIGAGTAMTSSTSLRAYRVSGKHFKLAGTTGSDMDSYGNLWAKQLHSPELPAELWLLVGGQALGANGPNIRMFRMRIYVYNGEKFATKWMPANVWGSFTITVTRNGFRVDGPYYQQENKERYDSYLVAPDGLYLCRPRQCE